MAAIPQVKMRASVLVPKPSKAKNLSITKEALALRAQRSIQLGYSKPKWVEFCEAAIDMGLSISLYEARRTASKYITLRNGCAAYKVRFSNHKPIKWKESGGDCDFFVGVANNSVTTTADALAAVRAHFGIA